MSPFNTQLRNSRLARMLPSARPAQPPNGSEPSAPDAPRWLLWSTGAAAVMLGLLAFLLWGFGGAATLLDMVVAFCT